MDTMVMDPEFAPMWSEINKLGVNLNTTTHKEHVPAVEQQIHTIKECMCCVHHTLPFKCLPILLLIKMVYFSVFWINTFPPKGGISDTMSP